MCKGHWKDKYLPLSPRNEPCLEPSPPPPSVYDMILPQSFSFKKQSNTNISGSGMPLIEYLKDNASEAFAWHRNLERRARGRRPVECPSVHFESWEKQRKYIIWEYDKDELRA